MKSTKNLLVIAYYFPPMGTVAFLRNYHIAKYLSRHFNSSHLITIKNVSIPLKDEIQNNFIQEHRVFNYDYRNLGNLLSSKNNDIRNKTNSKSSSWKVKFVRNILDSFPTNTLFGEGGLFYIINGTIKGIKLIRNNNITHLYSSFRPIADHIIAYNLKGIFPRLNWVADFRDPPVNAIDKSRFYQKTQWWFVNKLLSKASSITTVSDGVSSAFGKVKSITIKNGIYRLFENKYNLKYTKFTISFTGSLYPNLQKPEILFRALKELSQKGFINVDNFQLIYAGKDSTIWNNLIKEHSLINLSIDKSEVSIEDAIEIQNKSHINILFSWSNQKAKGILTGKLYEYLATGNQIFAFINGEKDIEFESVLRNINAGFVFYNNDIDSIQKTIEKLFDEWKDKGEILFKYNQIELNKYSWENRIKELEELF